VWPRDTRPPGKFGYEAGPTDPSREAEAAIRRLLDGLEQGSGRLADLDRPTRDGDLCLDCILVDQGEWWCGTHVAHDPPSRWSGGFFPDVLPPYAVSRAYLKVAEALAWSGLPIKSGDQAAEIGCAPGGSSQYLLEHGLYVLGVDPAAVDPRVAAHSRFTHLQKRGADVRRREFRKVKWLFADINVAPEYTFDTAEAIVTHPEVRVRGVVMMVKLLDWSLADEVPALLARAKSWGYPRVLARQLHHNRQEICVVATR
jgi:23S rRNA (cytidine2498-2'-O)-methyltransferase